MNKTLDIILFGATGFTGKYGILALYHLTKASEIAKQSLTWGIAGRSEAKLKETLLYCEKKLGHGANLKDIPIHIADVNDHDSLKKMTASARIIVNCCGPYRFYGEPVIKACIETSTHQVDVSGEPEFMESMQLKYHELAKEKGVYIINSCGFDSIVTDLGVIFLEQNFEGILNSVEAFYQRDHVLSTTSNATFNYGTWESVIHSLANAHKLKEIRSKLNRPLPKLLPKLQIRAASKKIQLIDGNYAVPMPSCDRSVILRSRRHLFDNKNMRPIQFENYYVIKSISGFILLAFYARMFQFLSQREYGRKLLLKFPDFFSNGYFTRAENLLVENVESSKFTLKMLGAGWDSNAAKLENDPYNFKDLPNRTIVGSIEGYNPSYGVASAAAVLSAIIVLSESDLLPSQGGVYTPAAAFIDTSLIQQLEKNKILSFNIKSKL